MIVHVSVGIDIKHTAVANFHIDLVKNVYGVSYHSGLVKNVYGVCYEEENAYLKDLRMICQFSFSSLG